MPFIGHLSAVAILIPSRKMTNAVEANPQTVAVSSVPFATCCTSSEDASRWRVGERENSPQPRDHIQNSNCFLKFSGLILALVIVAEDGL